MEEGRVEGGKRLVHSKLSFDSNGHLAQERQTGVLYMHLLKNIYTHTHTPHYRERERERIYTAFETHKFDECFVSTSMVLVETDTYIKYIKYIRHNIFLHMVKWRYTTL